MWEVAQEVSWRAVSPNERSLFGVRHAHKPPFSRDGLSTVLLFFLTKMVRPPIWVPIQGPVRPLPWAGIFPINWMAEVPTDLTSELRPPGISHCVQLENPASEHGPQGPNGNSQTGLGGGILRISGPTTPPAHFHLPLQRGAVGTPGGYSLAQAPMSPRQLMQMVQPTASWLKIRPGWVPRIF